LRRIVSSSIIALLFLSLFVFAFTVQPARAQSAQTITINPDGSITPSTANITTSGNVYMFTGNNYLPIIVDRSNIIIYGAGYTVQGTGISSYSSGMSVTGMSNVTIENVKITTFTYGVYLSSCSKCIVYGDNITGNSYGGIELDSSPNTSISDSNIANNPFGVWLLSSSGCTISANNITADREDGAVLDASSYCNVYGNTFQNDGLLVENSYHTFVKNNEVNGKPLYYLESVTVPTTVPSDVGQVVLVNCSNIVVNGLSLSNASTGVELWQTDSTRITKTTITKEEYGIYLFFSSGNTFSGNVLTANQGDGIQLWNSSGNNFSDNNVTANTYDGVDLFNSSGNNFSGNNFSDNNVTANANIGIYIGYSSDSNVLSGNTVKANGMYGIDLCTSSDNNTLSGNNVTANGDEGISVESSDSNVLSGNTVKASNWGVYLWSSSGNTFSGNNVTANTYDGIDLYSSFSNTLSGNNVTANQGDGIQLWNSSGNVLSGNRFTANQGDGIDLGYSSANVLSGNVMTGNTYNFGVGGNVLSDFVNYVDTSNLVNGKPVYYLIAHANIVISPQTYPQGVGYLGLVDCKNVTVQGLTLTKNLQGLLLAFTTDSKITDNNVTANSDGIDLFSSSDSNVLSCNNVTANELGIYVDSSDGNVLSCNNVTANIYTGIDLQYSSGNVLSGNTVTINGYVGVWLYFSSGNRIFHNDFLNNTQQASVFNSTNTWDNGYPSGGNYWSDYRTAYPNATEVDSSGIWNTSYIIDASNIDHYPLMALFSTFNAGTWNNTSYSVGVVSNSTISNFGFNGAAKTLTFDVSGPSGTVGFCRVIIPKSLMWCNSTAYWTVKIDGVPITNPTVTNDTSYTYIYFTYHHSTETVQIQSTNALPIPEFQPYMLLPLLMMITLLTAALSKRKRKVAHVTKPAKE
jgi:parallel beta-helix repeat protein